MGLTAQAKPFKISFIRFPRPIFFDPSRQSQLLQITQILANLQNFIERVQVYNKQNPPQLREHTDLEVQFEDNLFAEVFRSSSVS